jgi:hypothetical protein
VHHIHAHARHMRTAYAHGRDPERERARARERERESKHSGMHTHTHTHTYTHTHTTRHARTHTSDPRLWKARAIIFLLLSLLCHSWWATRCRRTAYNMIVFISNFTYFHMHTKKNLKKIIHFYEDAYDLDSLEIKERLQVTYRRGIYLTAPL